jgi:hypothetical protein
MQCQGAAVVDNEPGKSTVMDAAIKQVGVLTKQSAINRRHIFVIYIVASISFLAVIALIFIAFDQRSADRQLHNAGIQSCQAGNTYRAEQTEIWNDFIGLITASNAHPSAAALAEAHSFLMTVAKVDALRNCNALYGVGAASP